MRNKQTTKKKSAVIWYVATMDYIREQFTSKRAAVNWCKATCLDTRKRPTLERGAKQYNNFYEYHGPAPDKKTFYLGTKAGMEKHGFSEQLAEWEEDQREYALTDESLEEAKAEYEAVAKDRSR